MEFNNLNNRSSLARCQNTIRGNPEDLRFTTVEKSLTLKKKIKDPC